MMQTVTEKILSLAIERVALKFGEFKLSAGGTSTYYFDGRLVTLDPEGAYLVAKAMLPIVIDAGADAIAGPTLGADPIVAGVTVLSQVEGTPIFGLIVRKAAKGYGGKQIIEGPIYEGAKVAVVDDTCTSGSNLIRAIEAVEKAGCEVVYVACVLDRVQGGSDEVRRRGYKFSSLLKADQQGNIVA